MGLLRRRFAAFALGAALAAGASGALSPRAHAIDPTIRSIIVGGMYGIVAGTVLGLVSYPMTGSVRGIFMGTSIGMYLGAVAGGYYVANKDDPYNPLRRGAWVEPAPWWITAAREPARGSADGVQLGFRLASF